MGIADAAKIAEPACTVVDAPGDQSLRELREYFADNPALRKLLLAVAYVVDGTRMKDEPNAGYLDNLPCPAFVVVTKTDKPGFPGEDAARARFPGRKVCFTSAKELK